MTKHLKEVEKTPEREANAREQAELQPSLHPMLGMQQLVGNRAVVGLLESRGWVQTKPRDDPPLEEFEHEVDVSAPHLISARSPVVQRKCATCTPAAKCSECEEEETRVQRKAKDPPFRAVQLKSNPTAPIIQRAPRNSNSTATTPPAITSEPATSTAGPLIVDDDAATLSQGQMRKSEFLEQLRSTVCNTADEALAEAGQSTAGCPYIEQWFGYYADKPPAHIEAALRKYAPDAASAASARDYIPAVSNRVRQGVANWARTGDLTGVPEELQSMFSGPGAMLGVIGGAIGGALGSIGSAIGGAVSAAAGAIGGAFSRIGKALFKRKEGGTETSDDPQEIQARLSDGQPLSGETTTRMGAAFGHDFSSVRVHTDAGAAGLSEKLNARAFTIGSDIAFGAGEYQPGTMIGDALIAHELAHVAQQGGTAAAVNPKGEVSESESLEEEADDLAVDAVTSLWGEKMGALRRTGHDALPRLKSGLRLQRCSKESYDFELYRTQFNRLWTDPAFDTLSPSFDAALTSKGPRATKARKIFESIYAKDLALKKAYDGNISGVRERIDTYLGPEGLTIVVGAGGKTVTESPRLQALAAAFRRFDPPLSESEFKSFAAAVKGAAASLKQEDREAVENSNDWQRLIGDYCKTDDPNRPAIRRKEITEIIKTPPPSVEPPKPPAPPAPPPASADKAQEFVNNVTITGPAAPVIANERDKEVTLTPHSTIPNPAVVIDTKFTVTPSDRVREKNVSAPARWPDAAENGVPFKPKIINTSTVKMNAHLELVNGVGAPSPATPVQDVQFEVQDNRLANVLATWSMGFSFNSGGGSQWWNPKSAVQYRGGAQLFNAFALLPGAATNPGLTLFVKATVLRGGALVTITPPPAVVPFPPDQNHSPQIAMPISAPADPTKVPVTGDPLTVQVELIGDDGKTVIATKTETFNVLDEVPFTQAEAEAQAVDDEAFYRSDDPKKGLRGIMTNPAELKKVSPNIPEVVARNAVEALRSGKVKMAALTERHDSAAYVTAKNSGKPDPSKVGYFAGTHYALRDDKNSFVNNAGAAGFSRSPGDVLVNRTTDVKTMQKRRDADIIMFTVHEAVHALDIEPDKNTWVEQYKKEFRAYWMDGRHGPPDKGNCAGAPLGCKETAYDPTLPPPGPKTPRARAIFEHLYGDNLYQYVKENYDKNTDGFRTAVDNYLVPDGINLIVSLRLEALRRAIEDWNGRRFTTLIDDVEAALAKLDDNDRKEIVNNRAWRDLVERKVERKDIQGIVKSRMGIPK